MALHRFRHIAAVLVWGLLQTHTAGAQSVEQFYKGRTVKLIVPSATAGINDLAGRLVAKHIGRFIPGQPAIAVENKPREGGHGLLNDFTSAAPRDGSTIAIVQRAV